ncbi:MAG: FecR family protein [Devosia sp.]
MLRIALRLALFLMLTLPGFAEDWVANRLRGTAEQMVHGQWVPLVRGATVLDGQKVRTGSDGRVELLRGAEVLELDPGTQIELHEGAGKLTSVEMSSGTIVANVERRNVQHFSVQTPYLAAVVKGTIFRVSVGGGTARVEVDRGTVQVQDTINDLVVDIVRGQEAQVSQNAPLEVSGPGTAAIFTFEGERVVNGTSDVPADDRGRPVDTGENINATANVPAEGNGNSGGNGKGSSGNGSPGNGNSGNSNGNGNNGGNSSGNGNSGNGNSGGNGSGNSGKGNSDNGNANSGSAGGNGSSGGNGNGNSSGNGNGNGNSGGNGNGNSNSGNSGGNGNGNPGNGSSGNGNGHGNGRE